MFKASIPVIPPSPEPDSDSSSFSSSSSLSPPPTQGLVHPETLSSVPNNGASPSQSSDSSSDDEDLEHVDIGVAQMSPNNRMSVPRELGSLGGNTVPVLVETDSESEKEPVKHETPIAIAVIPAVVPLPLDEPRLEDPTFQPAESVDNHEPVDQVPTEAAVEEAEHRSSPVDQPNGDGDADGQLRPPEETPKVPDAAEAPETTDLGAIGKDVGAAKQIPKLEDVPDSLGATVEMPSTTRQALLDAIPETMEAFSPISKSEMGLVDDADTAVPIPRRLPPLGSPGSSPAPSFTTDEQHTPPPAHLVEEDDEPERKTPVQDDTDSTASTSRPATPKTPQTPTSAPRSLMRSRSRRIALSRSQYVKEKVVDVFGAITVDILSDKAKKLHGFRLLFSDEKMKNAYTMWSARQYGRRWCTVSLYLSVLLLAIVGVFGWWKHSLSFTTQFYMEADGLYLLELLIPAVIFLIIGAMMNIFKFMLPNRQFWLFFGWIVAMVLVPASELVLIKKSGVQFPLMLLPVIWFMSTVPRMKPRLVLLLGLVCIVSYGAFAVLYVSTSFLNLTLALHGGGLLIAILVGMMFALALEQAARNRFVEWYTLRRAHQQVTIGTQEADAHLMNIVPANMRNVFKSSPSALGQVKPNVGVLIVSVTDVESNFCARTGCSPEDTVSLINTLFARFDKLVEELKLETIGSFSNTYIVTTGITSSSTIGTQEDALVALARLSLLIHGEAMEQALEARKLSGCNQITLTLRCCCDVGSVARAFIGELIAGQFRIGFWGEPFLYLATLDRLCSPGSTLVTPRFRTHLEAATRNLSEFSMKETDWTRVPSLDRTVRPLWLTAIENVVQMRNRAMSERQDAHRGSMQRVLDSEHTGVAEGTGMMSNAATVSAANLPSAQPDSPRHPRIGELRGGPASHSSAAITRRDSNAKWEVVDEVEVPSKWCGVKKKTKVEKEEEKKHAKDVAEKSKKRRDEVTKQLMIHTMRAASDVRDTIHPITLRTKNDMVLEEDVWEFVLQRQGSIVRRLSIVALIITIIASAPEAILGWSSWSNLFTESFLLMAGGRAAWIVVVVIWIVIVALYRISQTAPPSYVSAVFLFLLGVVAIAPARIALPGGLLITSPPTLVSWTSALDWELVVGLCGVVMAVIVARVSFMLSGVLTLITLLLYCFSYFSPMELVAVFDTLRFVPPLSLVWIVCVLGVYGIERDQRLAFSAHQAVALMRPKLRYVQEESRRLMLCTCPPDPAVRWKQANVPPVDLVENGGVLCVRLTGISKLISDKGIDSALSYINTAFEHMDAVAENRDLVRASLFADVVLFTVPSTTTYKSEQFWISRLCHAAIDMNDAIAQIDCPHLYISAAIANGRILSAAFGKGLKWDCIDGAVNDARWLELMGEPGTILLSEKVGVMMTPYFDMDNFKSKAQHVLTDTELREAFDLLDRDHNGNLEANELVAAMAQFGRHMSLQEAQKTIDEADVDGDSFMQFDEFAAFIRVDTGGSLGLRETMRLNDSSSICYVLKGERDDAPTLFLPEDEMMAFEKDWVERDDDEEMAKNAAKSRVMHRQHSRVGLVQ